MPTDTGAILKLSRSIAALSKEFEDAKIPEKSVQDALVSAAEQLAIATREPDENMYHIASQVIALKPQTILRQQKSDHPLQIAHNAALRSVLSMGVLDEVPLDGSAISAEDLASRLSINPELVGMSTFEKPKLLQH